MAAFDTSRPFAAAGSNGRVRGLFIALVAAFNSWNDARITRKSLNVLTDRELEDIGMIRSDIDGVVGRM